MFSLDSLVLDLVLPADARPTPEALLAALGGEEVAKKRLILDPDLDAPQIEMEISPTVPLRRRGERRLWIVEEGPLRKDPRREPIVPRDLRIERARLVALVDKLGARFGRMNAFGSWGDAAIVVRSARDLRGLALLSWALDPQVDIDGRRRAKPLSEQEFELKIAAYERRLEELDDASVLGRVAPATLGKQGDLIVVDVLSDIDGSWDVRKSYELEKRIAAFDQFARIPGARVTPEPPPPPPAPPPATAPPEPPPAQVTGPPIRAVEAGARLVLVIPSERLDLDAVTALGKRQLDLLGPRDQVTGKQRDRIHQDGCGFVAPLAYLSEVFLDGKPLDRKRFDADAAEIAPGVRALEAHLPRFGPVRVIDAGGKRYVTSEVGVDPRVVVGWIG